MNSNGHVNILQQELSNQLQSVIFHTFPCLQTIRLEKTSGIEVPTARNERPITVSGTPIVNPMIVIIQVTKYEITPIQEMHNTNDSGANFRKILLLQHLTVCPCSGKLLDSFDGALKIKKYLGHFRTRFGPFFRKFYMC